MDETTDTCPACGATVVVPHTGEWVWCDRLRCKGKLRWKADGKDSPRRALLAAERQYLEGLRKDLQEMDEWVREGIPGAARVADQIQRLLLGLVGEK